MFTPLNEIEIYPQFENLIPEASIGDFSGRKMSSERRDQVFKDLKS